jgi:hypothetical protein
MQKIIALLVFVAACGSGKSSFSGDGEQAAAPVEELAKPTYSSDVKPVVTVPVAAPQPAPELGAIPARAVRNGSFAVWTEPADPEPFQNYEILVRVTLPEEMAVGYSPKEDLFGQVTGSDGFTLGFGFGLKIFIFETYPDGGLIHVGVPGGGRIVQDTIVVNSFILKENQVLTITF